jgi:signal transduction histidine kinase
MLAHDEIHSQSDMVSSVEERLLTIFRALAVIRLIVAMLFTVLPELSNLPWNRYISIGEVFFLLVYLSIPALKRKLGRYYLPIAIAWATILPLLAQNLVLYREVETLSFTTLTEPQSLLVENALILGSINQTILILIVPLIVVAWAYSRKVLTLYCCGIALFDLLVPMLLIPANVTVFLIAFALIVFRTLLYAVIGIMINQLVHIQLEQQRKLLDANKKLQEYALVREQLATSRERNRLARELHDTLAHTLSAATVQLEAVNIIWDQQPQKAQQMVMKSAAMMRSGLAETRQVLHALRAGSLDNSDLINAVTTLADSLMTRYPLLIQVHAPAAITVDDAAVEHGLYRITQEAMFNAARHAQARHVTVHIANTDAQLRITITDDGVGFDLDTATANGHFGIRGMHERAQQINADLHITSRLGEGTKVTVTWTGER